MLLIQSQLCLLSKLQASQGQVAMHALTQNKQANTKKGPRTIAAGLRACVALTVDPGSISSTHHVSSNHQFQGF